MLPSKNGDYSQTNFWENRYLTDRDGRREWLGDYSMLSDYFRSAVPDKKASILMLGCGNSLLSEQLFQDGYENIHNIDISSSVIETMSRHCDDCSRMHWYTMDVRSLDFPDGKFNVVLEKATLDVFLVAEKTPWRISSSTIDTLKTIANEIDRVLEKPNGQFFSVTFSAKHFRLPLLESIFDDRMKVFHVENLGKEFHFYMYHLRNDPLLPRFDYFRYQPPKVTLVENESANNESENETDNFLLNMEM